MGIDGSVLLSLVKGQKTGDNQKANTYFSASVMGSILLAAAAWAVLLWFETSLLRMFGADDALLDLARSYLIPIKFVFPLFLFNQMLAAFLRNDNDPARATWAVVAGGVFNVAGDILFVFPMRMGILGAGLAAALGAVISFVLMMTHFFSKKNTLGLVKVHHLWPILSKITVTGFSTFFIDIAMGILTILFNNFV